MKNYEALSDEQLIELLRKGESGPEEYLVKKYKGMVLKRPMPCSLSAESRRI